MTDIGAPCDVAAVKPLGHATVSRTLDRQSPTLSKPTISRSAAPKPAPASPATAATECARFAGIDAHRPARPVRTSTECGDLPFLIKRDGTWLYRGTPINRKELVCLFASVLRREEDGSWWLQTPAERGRIQVEDAPFVAVELDWTGDGRHQVLSFRTNVDEVVTAGPDHPIRISHDLITCEPTPYVRIRPGGGHLAVEARINRATYYELVALAVPEWVGNRRLLGVWSCGQFFSLGEMPTGEA